MRRSNSAETLAVARANVAAGPRVKQPNYSNFVGEMRGGLNFVLVLRPMSRVRLPASFLVGLPNGPVPAGGRFDDDWHEASRSGKAGRTSASPVIGAGGARLNCAASDNLPRA